MSVEAWVALFIIVVLLIAGFLMWWTNPDDLEGVRQRERALKAMAKWTR